MSFKKGNLYTNEAKTEGIYPNTVYSAIYKDDMSKTLDADLGDLSHYNAQTITSGIDPIYLHLDMDLLWTNASPTSTFNSQTLTIDLTDYKLIMIEVRSFINPSSQNGTFSSIFRKEIGVTYGIDTRYNNNTGDGGIRNIKFSNSSIEISGSNLNNNEYCIPYKIYGIR